MATKATKSKAEAAEWQANTVAEFAENDKYSWRAQQIINPEGKRMLGLRRFVKLASGEERHTSAGFMVPYSKDGAKSLRKIAGLLEELQEVAATAKS